MCETSGGNVAHHNARESRFGDLGPTSLPPQSPLIFQSPLDETVHKLKRTFFSIPKKLDAIWAPHVLGVELDPNLCQQLLLKEVAPVTCPDGRLGSKTTLHFQKRHLFQELSKCVPNHTPVLCGKKKPSLHLALGQIHNIPCVSHDENVGLNRVIWESAQRKMR